MSEVYKCQICEREFSTKRGLSLHIHTHKEITIKKYYDTYIRKKEEGICKCCGSETIFQGLNGYTSYCSTTCSNRTNTNTRIEYWLKKTNGNMEEAQRLLSERQNTSSLEFKISKYGEEEGRKKYKEAGGKISYTSSIEYYIDKYGEEDGLRLLQENNAKKSVTLESCINKRGYVEGKKVYEQWKESCSHNKEFYITKYGNEKGNLIYDSMCENIKNTANTRIEYWLEKTDGDLEEAQKLLSERQATFSKNKCIEKHGEEEGLRIWQERQDKWQNTLNSKSDEEIREINKKKVFNHNGVSKQQLELCEILIDKGIPLVNYDMEELLLITENDKMYLYDITYNNKIIEYMGDFWHCNPEKYNEAYIHELKNMKASEIWEYDRIKKEFAESQGYEVMYIWENDFIKDKENTINKCVDFLSSEV